MPKIAYLISFDGQLVTEEDVSRNTHMSQQCCYLKTLENAVEQQTEMISKSDAVFILNCAMSHYPSDLTESAIEAAELKGILVYYYA